MSVKHKTAKELLEEERRKNAALREANEKNTANLDYVAMMCDAEIPTDDENEEVSGND